MPYFVYILQTNKGTLYTGITTDIKRRIKEHGGTKRSAKYMRSFDSFTLVYSEKFGSRSEALKRESEIKKLSKAKKEELIR